MDPLLELQKKEEADKETAARQGAMETLIRSSESKFLTLEHNGINIRIRPALPGAARMGVLALAKKYKGVNVEKFKCGQANLTDLPDGCMEDSLEQLYRTLAALCPDDPYNNPESWRYFDEKTGEAELIYQKAEKLMEEAHKTAIAFLEKS
jgi:hypothetical protein